MKIIVVNYNELNNPPSNSEVLTDIKSVFDSASQTVLEDMGSRLREDLTKLFLDSESADMVFMDTSDIYKRNHLESFVGEQKPDLLISYNLAGFELSTLTDSLLYNLMDCRQFHIIKKKELPNERCLEKLRSINLFIFDQTNV
ncbi:MAG: hypothetical protein K6G75_13115 [Lachnospiraceae bacterium]|nr:hypothetical protein [Lachnospiraceae bacterium]